MSAFLARSWAALRRAAFPLWLWDAQRKLRRFGQFLNAGDRILDIGSGSGSVTFLLRQRAIHTTPLDVEDRSFADHLSPTLYEGRRIPFAVDDFDAALLLTVLHHTSNPDQILREASRVARRIVITEDVYNSRIGQLLTYSMDRLMNLQFFNHPRQNKRDSEWQDLFMDLGLRLVYCRTDRLLLLFRQATYVLERVPEVQSEASRAVPQSFHLQAERRIF